ncbi:MAG: dihydrodipicolinate reductase C-terminal domain-containing protein [Ignavibacteria bacterium]|nr:dihydrodipicolinate reductase C-terminal domain-containing protein [Ignavibacteria bacterium]
MKYGLIGSTGRLGGEVINVFNEKRHQLVYELDSNKEVKNDVPQLLIDCSLPSAFIKTIELVKQFNIPLVIATTGLTENELQKLKDLSANVPVVQSSNFSIGVQVLLKVTEMANDVLNDWDVEISETHHRFKKDKPSGTALMIKDKLGSKPVNISSLRLGNIVGDHTITFGGLGDTISITHHAISRRTFAEGILKSAEFVLKKKNGFYSFKEVIFGS